MKKIALTIAAALILGPYAWAQMDISTWEGILAATDTAWQQGAAQYRQGKITDSAKLYSWLPSLTADPSYSKTDDTHSFSLSINLSQKLPLNGSFSASLSQKLSSEAFADGSYGYQTSVTANISQPLPLSDIGSFYVLKSRIDSLGHSASTAAQARWQATRTDRIADSLSLLLETALLIKRQIVRQELIDWYEASVASLEGQRSDGMASDMDIRELRQNLDTARLDFASGSETLALSMAQCSPWGFEPGSVDVEAWISALETEIATRAGITSAEWRLAAELSDLSTSAEGKIDEALAAMPSLKLSYNFSPAESVAASQNAWSSITDYWKRDMMLDGTFSVSASISLVPWAGVWTAAGKGAAARSSLTASLADIQARLDRAPALRQLALERATLAVTQAERTMSLEKDRLELYRFKAERGDLSAQDIAYQEIQADNARLDWLTARIERIALILKGE